MQKTKINSFQKLNAWQKSHSATLIIYGLTKEFPLEETYGLSRQMRRAAVSVGSNIAEGFNRRSQKEKAHFYQMGVASIGELQNQLMVARDLDYIPLNQFLELEQVLVDCHKLLNGLIKAVKA